MIFGTRITLILQIFADDKKIYKKLKYPRVIVFLNCKLTSLSLSAFEANKFVRK
jgi:hypothetical protein